MPARGVFHFHWRLKLLEDDAAVKLPSAANCVEEDSYDDEQYSGHLLRTLLHLVLVVGTAPAQWRVKVLAMHVLNGASLYRLTLGQVRVALSTGHLAFT